MLVLTRKIGERIVIGDDIRIVAISQREGRVRLGIQAPPDVPVEREERYLEKQRNKEQQDAEGDPATPNPDLQV